MGAEPRRAHVGRRGSECAPAEDHGARLPRNGGHHAQASRSAPRRRHDPGRRPRLRSHPHPWPLPLIGDSWAEACPVGSRSRPIGVTVLSLMAFAVSPLFVVLLGLLGIFFYNIFIAYISMIPFLPLGIGFL